MEAQLFSSTCNTCHATVEATEYQLRHFLYVSVLLTVFLCGTSPSNLFLFVLASFEFLFGLFLCAWAVTYTDHSENVSRQVDCMLECTNASPALAADLPISSSI
eukprot:5324282-Amphidinium_carterae.1